MGLLFLGLIFVFFHKGFIMDETSDHMPYEGAGFLLSYQGNLILGSRIKKEKDLVADPTPELEYMGGKVEVADFNDPYRTAHSELIEELGQDILEAGWRDRAQVIHIYQPFSKHWIWCFRLELTPTEHQRLLEAATNLAAWDKSETRNFSAVTGRSVATRKALEVIVQVDRAELVSYIERFHASPASENRMKDAKAFRAQAQLQGHSVIDAQQIVAMPLRAFNAVMFENHISKI